MNSHKCNTFVGFRALFAIKLVLAFCSYCLLQRGDYLLKNYAILKVGRVGYDLGRLLIGSVHRVKLIQ